MLGLYSHSLGQHFGEQCQPEASEARFASSFGVEEEDNLTPKRRCHILEGSENPKSLTAEYIKKQHK
jgi:hypothetical protein